MQHVMLLLATSSDCSVGPALDVPFTTKSNLPPLLLVKIQ